MTKEDTSKEGKGVSKYAKLFSKMWGGSSSGTNAVMPTANSREGSGLDDSMT